MLTWDRKALAWDRESRGLALGVWKEEKGLQRLKELGLELKSLTSQLRDLRRGGILGFHLPNLRVDPPLPARCFMMIDRMLVKHLAQGQRIAAGSSAWLLILSRPPAPATHLGPASL